MSGKIDFKFYAITDRKKLSETIFLTHLEKALSLGIHAIQLREKDLSVQDQQILAQRIKALAAKYGARLLINDRVDIALALDLDGVHLTEQSMPCAQARKTLGSDKLIGVSVHDRAGAMRAQSGGADFVVLGPVSATPSKPGVHAMDPLEFSNICSTVDLPVFALGGITIEKAGFWIQKGAYGVAGISLWMEPAAIDQRLISLKTTLGGL